MKYVSGVSMTEFWVLNQKNTQTVRPRLASRRSSQIKGWAKEESMNIFTKNSKSIWSQRPPAPTFTALSFFLPRSTQRHTATTVGTSGVEAPWSSESNRSFYGSTPSTSPTSRSRCMSMWDTMISLHGVVELHHVERCRIQWPVALMSIAAQSSS